MKAEQINSPETLLQYIDDCLIDFENGKTNRGETWKTLVMAFEHVFKLVEERESRIVGEALIAQQNFKNILDSGNMYLINPESY